MKERNLLIVYAILSIISFAFLVKEAFIESSVSKVLSLIVLGYLFINKSKKWHILFFSILLFSSIKEVALIYGGENYPQTVTIAATFIYALTLLLIKKSTKKTKVRIKREYILSLVPIVIILVYFIITVLTIVFEKIDIPFVLPILCALFFLALILYMGSIYFREKSMKNLWLLLALMTHVFTFLITPIEALMLPSIYLLAVINVVIVACHFFVYKFLITPEYKVEFEDKTFYL